MKKRLWAIFLSICLVVTLLPNVALAADGKSNESGTTAELPELTKPVTSGTSGGIDWKVENDTLTISPSSNPERDFDSGKMVEDYGTLTPVDADYIAALKAAEYIPGSNGHFYYPGTETWVSNSPWKFLSKQITSVVVENGVTSIAARAFRLPNVTEVSIPASVTSIGKLAFEACEQLTTVNWTGEWDNHIKMPFNGFSRCSSLGNGYELTDWMPACFYVNGQRDSIYVNGKSDSIEGTQFTVNFDELNKRLENDAATYPLAMFRSVPNIISATLTSKLNVDYIFEYSGIQNVTIADDQTSIATAAFHGCQDLESVVIPVNVKEIKSRAFADSGLKSIEFSGPISPKFGSFAFEKVSLDSLTLNKKMSITEAVKIIGELTREGAITDNTKIAPAKFANYKAEDVVVDGAEGAAINNQNYPLVKNLTINGAYTSADKAFGNSDWGKETLKTLTIHAAGADVTINKFAFMRAPLKSVKIEAKELKFTGDAAFLNTMLLTHIDLTGVDNITLDAGDTGDTGGTRTFVINDTKNGGETAPIRYVYFKNATAYKAMSSQFGGNTNTYYLVTDGGTVAGEQDGFSAVVKGGYTAEWHAKADFTDSAVETPVAGKVYYAKWTKNDNVTLTSAPTAEDGTVTAAYDPNGAVTLSVQNPGADWLYVWMKDGEPINGTESSLTLYTPSQSGEYSVQIMTKGSNPLTWTSNAINVTITKAAGTASVSMDGWAYGETAKAPVPTSATNGTDGVTYQYKVKDAEDSTYSPAVPTAAGSYTVKATFPATANYEEATATADFTIAKATPAISIIADKTTLAGGGTVKLTVSGVPEGGAITVTQTDDQGSGAKTLPLTGNGEVSVTLDNTTTKYTFKVSYEGDKNHEVVENIICTVSVTRYYSGGGSSSSGSSYAVTAPSAKNGDVTVSPKNASKGDRVTITVKPDSGYTLETLTVIDSKGNEIQLTDKGEGKYTFTMPAGKVEVKATFMDDNTMLNFFVDVKSGDYYYDAVLWAARNGITSGTDAVHFSPEQPCTRAQIVTFLWRAAGAPEPKGTAASLTDVVSGSYYEKAVAWAIENGITTGTGDGEFSPDDTCTRAQAVTFLARALNAKAAGKAEFSDVSADSYFADAVAWAAANGVTEGIGGGLFGSDNDCTRGQIVTFLYRAYNK